MPLIKTSQDLGHAIRSRRKELGWDQATLAKQVGVTRQWVIDIEKGKPRAELELALRALRVLGVTLTAGSQPAIDGQKEIKRLSAAQPEFDVNKIVDDSKSLASSTLAEFLIKGSRPKTAAELVNNNSSSSWPTASAFLTNRIDSMQRDLVEQSQPKSTSDLLKSRRDFTDPTIEPTSKKENSLMELLTLLNGVPIGRLTSDRHEKPSLEYLSEWKAATGATPLSLSLPLSRDRDTLPTQ